MTNKRIYSNKMVLTGVYAASIPTRFLILLAHFFILVSLLWDRDENFRLCSLKYISYDPEYAEYYFYEYVLTLTLSLVSVLIEFLGFACGISMFCELHSLLSIVTHTIAAFTWSLSYLEKWDCSVPYGWYIFIFCLAPPLVSELVNFIRFIHRTSQHY